MRVLNNYKLKYPLKKGKNNGSLNFVFLFSQLCKKRTFPVFSLDASNVLACRSSTSEIYSAQLAILE